MPTALVVDDDETTRDFLRHYLFKMGVTCAEAKDGRDALMVLAGIIADVIITDLEMPVMGGIELITQLQVSPFKNVPVVALSAHPQMLEKAREMGATCLTKPIRYHAFATAVSPILAP